MWQGSNQSYGLTFALTLLSQRPPYFINNIWRARLMERFNCRW
jgi:hypothetical protein